MSCLTSARVQRTRRLRLCLPGYIHDHDPPSQQVLLLLHRRAGLPTCPLCHPAVIQTSAEHWSSTISQHVVRWPSSHHIPPTAGLIQPGSGPERLLKRFRLCYCHTAAGKTEHQPSNNQNTIHGKTESAATANRKHTHTCAHTHNWWVKQLPRQCFIFNLKGGNLKLI